MMRNVAAVNSKLYFFTKARVDLAEKKMEIMPKVSIFIFRYEISITCRVPAPPTSWDCSCPWGHPRQRNPIFWAALERNIRIGGPHRHQAEQGGEAAQRSSLRHQYCHQERCPRTSAKIRPGFCNLRTSYMTLMSTFSFLASIMSLSSRIFARL